MCARFACTYHSQTTSKVLPMPLVNVWWKYQCNKLKPMNHIVVYRLHFVVMNFCINKELALILIMKIIKICLTKLPTLYSNYACIPVLMFLSFHAEKLMLALNLEQWEWLQTPWLTATVNQDNTLPNLMLLFIFLCTSDTARLFYCWKELYELYIRHLHYFISGHVIYNVLICWTL